MKQKDFDRPVKSGKQAGAIRRRQIKSERTTEFRTEDVRAIRRQLRKSQQEFALMIGVSVATLQPSPVNRGYALPLLNDVLDCVSLTCGLVHSF